MAVSRRMYRTMAMLRTALLGKTTESYMCRRLEGMAPPIEHVVEEVRLNGNVIEIVWDNGMVLATRLKMFGAWHLYREGEELRRPESHVSVMLDVGEWRAVCFGALHVETYRDFDLRRHPMLGSHGPDLGRDGADIEECVDRMMAYEERDATIAEVLVDERVMTGVGNVYRCEALWACEAHPWARIGEFKPAECREIVTLMCETLRADRMGVSRVSRAVYGRQGKACMRCGDVIKVSHHGEANRVLYWCPGCQTAHEPLTRPNFTPLYVDRDATTGDTHPAARMFMNEINARRAENF